MAGWRCGSTVKRRCGLRWFKSTRGQASMNAGGPSALATGAGGVLWRRGHDDGAHGGTPASLHALRWLTGLCQRARGETMGCWGDGGAITVAKEQRGRAGDGYGDGGGAGRARLSLRRGRRSRKWEMKRGATRANAGGVKAVPRRGVACAVRALATRGRRRGHAARKLCSGRPLKNGRFSSSVVRWPPDSAFSR